LEHEEGKVLIPQREERKMLILQREERNMLILQHEEKQTSLRGSKDFWSGKVDDNEVFLKDTSRGKRSFRTTLALYGWF
jgi:hypothetical protein